MKNIVWIFSTVNILAFNLQEILELEGYDVSTFLSLPRLEYSLALLLPQILIFDELNCKGGYSSICKQLGAMENRPKIMVMNDEVSVLKFPHSDHCIPIPFDTNELLFTVNSWRDDPAIRN